MIDGVQRDEKSINKEVEKYESYSDSCITIKRKVS